MSRSVYQFRPPKAIFAPSAENAAMERLSGPANVSTRRPLASSQVVTAVFEFSWLKTFRLMLAEKAAASTRPENCPDICPFRILRMLMWPSPRMASCELSGEKTTASTGTGVETKPNSRHVVGFQEWTPRSSPVSQDSAVRGECAGPRHTNSGRSTADHNERIIYRMSQQTGAEPDGLHGGSEQCKTG
jgi:hypothetical protein